MERATTWDGAKEQAMMAREERAMRLKSLTAISCRERAGGIKECRGA